MKTVIVIPTHSEKADNSPDWTGHLVQSHPKIRERVADVAA
ncbi:MAG: hypothetical protein ACXWXF_02075 [Aeromicrobium sp.]